MVLNEVEKGKMVGIEAAEVSGGSERNRCRILAAYRGGSAGLHGKRGRKPVHSFGEEIRKRL